jgi:hypothetical protein
MTLFVFIHSVPPFLAVAFSVFSGSFPVFDSSNSPSASRACNAPWTYYRFFIASRNCFASGPAVPMFNRLAIQVKVIVFVQI